MERQGITRNRKGARHLATGHAGQGVAHDRINDTTEFLVCCSKSPSVHEMKSGLLLGLQTEGQGADDF